MFDDFSPRKLLTLLVLAAAIIASAHTQAAYADTTTSLGTFSLLAESATSGNSLVLNYGKSFDGNGLNTYWAGADSFTVLSAGAGQYEISETVGGRCIATTAATVSLAACNGSAAQLYTLTAQSDGSYLIQSSSSTCLYASGAFAQLGAKACDASSFGERWKFTGVTPFSPAASTPVSALPPAPTGGSSSLGTFSMLSQSASAGNALNLNYGQSFDGNHLNTYWAGAANVTVLSTGSGQYEFVETVGSRCVTTSGNAVTIGTCTGAATQLYTLAAQGDGSYLIQSSASTCLNSAAAFSNLDAPACSASSAGERWKFSGATAFNPSGTTAVTPTPTPTPAPTPTPTPTVGTSLGVFSMLVQSAGSGNSLNLGNGVSSDGNGFITYWAGADTLKVLSMGNSQYEIVETGGGRCVTVNGSQVSMSGCSAGSGQMFGFTAQPDGSYLLQAASGNCLTATGAFVVVTAQTCGTASAQHWKFTGTTALNAGTPAPTPTPTPSPTPTPTPAGGSTIVNSSMVPAGYHITFDDEFQTLNLSDSNNAGTRWYTHTVQCCLYDTSNPSTLTYMAGLSDGSGKTPYTLASGGGLDISLQKSNGAWYSGVLATVDSNGNGFSQQYGYFEMKAKFPAAGGTWPAFWLLNTNRLTQNAPSGEIDILESYMQFPTYINTTLHDWGAGTYTYHQSQVGNMASDYHVFGMLWTAATMTFYCDGVQLWQTPTPSVMNQPYYPIVDLGLGGGWPTDVTPSRNDMYVQYVRVYSNQ